VHAGQKQLLKQAWLSQAEYKTKALRADDNLLRRTRAAKQEE